MLGLFKRKKKTSQVKILVVDDEPDLVSTVEYRLKFANCSVVTASNGQQGLAAGGGGEAGPDPARHEHARDERPRDARASPRGPGSPAHPGDHGHGPVRAPGYCGRLRTRHLGLYHQAVRFRAAPGEDPRGLEEQVSYGNTRTPANPDRRRRHHRPQAARAAAGAILSGQVRGSQRGPSGRGGGAAPESSPSTSSFSISVCRTARAWSRSFVCRRRRRRRRSSCSADWTTRTSRRRPCRSACRII